MVVKLGMSPVEKKYHIKIILKFGGHFVNGNDVDMSYLRKLCSACGTFTLTASSSATASHHCLKECSSSWGITTQSTNFAWKHHVLSFFPLATAQWSQSLLVDVEKGCDTGETIAVVTLAVLEITLYPFVLFLQISMLSCCCLFRMPMSCLAPENLFGMSTWCFKSICKCKTILGQIAQVPVLTFWALLRGRCIRRRRCFHQRRY